MGGDEQGQENVIAKPFLEPKGDINRLIKWVIKSQQPVTKMEKPNPDQYYVVSCYDIYNIPTWLFNLENHSSNSNKLSCKVYVSCDAKYLYCNSIIISVIFF